MVVLHSYSTVHRNEVKLKQKHDHIGYDQKEDSTDLKYNNALVADTLNKVPPKGALALKHRAATIVLPMKWLSKPRQVAVHFDEFKIGLRAMQFQLVQTFNGQCSKVKASLPQTCILEDGLTCVQLHDPV